MTSQRPAAPETETDARGRLAERLTWAVEKCCQCTDGHHDWPANPYGTEGDVRMSRDDARMIVALLADLDAARERVRVVEGERDDLADRLSALLCDLTGGLMSKTNYPVSVMVQAVEAEFEKYATAELVDATARAESAEAAHEAEKAAHERLRAGVEALADEWAEDYPGPNAACNRTPDEWSTDLRSILCGGEAR